MTEIDELRTHLEHHPDDHATRWTLAKKLYMGVEYGEALGQLAILKEKWVRKLNVSRYLAATYYRLGQYDDAVAELRQALKEWPDEVALHMQLARVYEVAGNREEAARSWEEVLRINPRDAMAAEAVDRLSREPEATAEEDLHLKQSDSGINIAEVRVCSNCGAQNSPDFDRCWQCHAVLPGRDGRTPTPMPLPRDQKPASHSWVWVLLTGLVIVAVVALGVFTGLWYYSDGRLPFLPAPASEPAPEAAGEAAF